MMSLQQYKNSNNIKSLIAKLFEARQVAHNVHLQTKSYSEHKALNRFYEDVLDLTDSLVESYQGQYGILTGYEKLIQIEPVNEMVNYLEDCAKIFALGRDAMKDSDSHLKNILDEIVSLTYSTLYKLKNLK
jgi:hypothetical protein